jgi:hypothetical protein
VSPSGRELGARSAPSGGTLRRPWLGAIVAFAGLVALWIALQSMPWLDSASGNSNLSQLGATADALGQYRVVAWFADWGWKLLVAYVIAVAVAATLVTPTNRGARTLLWLPLAGPFALFNLTDRDGSAAPRVLGLLAMLAPAAVLGVVLADLLVEPQIDPSVQAPSELSIDPDALEQSGLTQEDIAEGRLDSGTLQDLVAAGGLDNVGLQDLASLGLDWRGFALGEIGTGLWASFGGLAIVGAGAAIGTRSARR